MDSEKQAKMNALMALMKEMDGLMGSQIKGLKSEKVEVEPMQDGMEVAKDKIMIEKEDDEEESC